jgi:transcriptional regulator with XRE-family HTH domain
MNKPPPAIRIQTPEDLGKAIREQRKHNGLTLVEAAGLTNVGVRFLSELENGKPTVRLDKLLLVVNGLGLRLSLTTPDRRTS